MKPSTVIRLGAAMVWAGIIILIAPYLRPAPAAPLLHVPLPIMLSTDISRCADIGGGGTSFAPCAPFVRTLPVTGEGHLLVVPLINDEEPYEEQGYRMRLYDITDERYRLVWQDDNVPAERRQYHDGTFIVEVSPGRLVQGHTYRLIVFGVIGGNAKKLDSYRIRIREEGKDS